VPGHHLWAPGINFPWLSYFYLIAVLIHTFHFRTWKGQSDRPDSLGTINGVARKHWRSFGKTVTLCQGYTGYFFPSTGYRFLYCHSSSYSNLQIFKTGVTKRFLIQQTIKYGIYSGNNGKWLLFQFFNISTHIPGIGYQNISGSTFKHRPAVICKRKHMG